MFDIGFPELILIAIVGLLVIGPERLPEALRTMGLWIGRMRRSFTNVKTEIEKEIGMDEIRRQLHNEAVMEEMKRIERDVRDSVNATPGQSRRDRPAQEQADDDAAATDQTPEPHPSDGQLPIDLPPRPAGGTATDAADAAAEKPAAEQPAAEKPAADAPADRASETPADAPADEAPADTDTRRHG